MAHVENARAEDGEDAEARKHALGDVLVAMGIRLRAVVQRQRSDEHLNPMSASPVSAERRITDYVLSPSHIPAPEIPDISDEDLRAFVAAAWAMIDEEEGLEQEAPGPPPESRVARALRRHGARVSPMGSSSMTTGSRRRGDRD